MGSPQADARSTLVLKHAETARAGFHDRGDDVSTGVSKARAWAATTIHVGPRPEPIGGPTSDRGASPAPICFPPDNFKHSLTLFSKSFSSFPRGTCSLPVSRPYLALDEIYRPIRAAFPNNPTRRQRLVVRQGSGTTGLSPSPVPLSRGLGPIPPLRTLLQTTIQTPRATDSQAGLFPAGFDNDPSAGSPTETLLRLLLPLNVRFSGLLATSRAANRPRRRDPNTSPDHSIGRSDGRINQVAFLRDVRPACSSTHYLGRGEAITGQDHRSCRGTKYTSYERPGPRPYADEIYRIQKHDRASMHRRARIMLIDTLGTPTTTEVHQAATRSLDEKGMTIHPKFHRFRYVTQDPYRTPWARRPQGEDIEEECGSTVRCMKHGACRHTQPFHHSHAYCVLVAASTPTGPQPTRAKDSIKEERKQ
ncbi:hypothetical protein V6N13_081046 [Hibiscus sabdariffa]